MEQNTKIAGSESKVVVPPPCTDLRTLDRDAKFVRDGITYPSTNELCQKIQKQCAQLSTKDIWKGIKDQTAWDPYTITRPWFNIYFAELAKRASGPRQIPLKHHSGDC